MAEDEESMEALRRKKMADVYQQAQARAQQEEQLRSALAMLLEPKAYERLMLVKMSSPDLFAKAVQAISYLQQARQLKGRLNEEQMRALLVKLAGARKEGTITIHRKGGNETRGNGSDEAVRAGNSNAAGSREEG
jgi:programmed cell death protein 5